MVFICFFVIVFIYVMNINSQNILRDSLASQIKMSEKAINDKTKIWPAYLQMYFERSEFNRYARFHSWGSARETFDFDEMCDVEIPIPNIKIQKAISDIYAVYIERKHINERLKERIKNICPILIKGSLDEGRV